MSKKLVKEFIEEKGISVEGFYKVDVYQLLNEFMLFLKTKQNGKEEKEKT
jgi:hypothetical protein